MRSAEGARAAVFVDRDGTLIDEREYLADPEDVRLLPGAAEAVRRLRDAGLAVVVVTNQSGIARGLYTQEDYHAVAERLESELESRGAPLDATYHCPHHPDFTGPCACRKPGVKLYRDAAAELGLDLTRSFFVGDKVSDVVPAHALGGRGILVRTGYGREHEETLPGGLLVADDLGAAAGLILHLHGAGDVDPTAAPG